MSQPSWSLLTTNTSRKSIADSGAKGGAPDRRQDSISENGANGDDSTWPIIAICHLSWDWVWQRPQQYLSRFARQHRVLFVETYRSDVPQTRVELQPAKDHPNLTVLKMHIPASRWHDGAFVDAERRRALKATLANELSGEFENALLWFYDPMAVTAFAGHLDERAIVYDCMDELSQFKGAPPTLLERERELLLAADVVFCGGQKMRQKRLPINGNTHFFGTGVDIAHFGQALSDDLAIAPDVVALNGAPVLGYFGVIDERIDYELLARLADAQPDWQIMMVGPTAKVDPAGFPQRSNLHWIGGRPYSALPALTKGWSVALMPFALNAATEYINPTKALEYMAAGRPVVSTALDEVKLNFGEVARIAQSHDEFIALCAAEVKKPSRTRIKRGLKLATNNTWEANVVRMKTHIAEVLAPARQRAARAAATQPSLSQPLTRLAYV